MPARQLMTAALEHALNAFLDTQTAVHGKLEALRGKRLSVFLDVLDKGITLVFDDKIIVVNGPDTFVEAKSDVDASTCIVNTKLSVLSQLSDTSQLTSLIQKGDLELVGDIAIAQQVSDVFAGKHLDFEEALANYTSDVFAHSVFSVFGAIHRKATTIVQSLAMQGAELAIEERPIAARQQGVEGVGQQIEQLRDDAERVRLKLERFEKNMQESIV